MPVNTKQPQLGSLALESPSSSSQTVHVTPSTCYNLSLFKDLLKEYRKLDDTVTMRMNRTTAQFRDRERGSSRGGKVQDEACAYFWKQLVENWKKRSEIIHYCVDVMDKTLEEKRASDGTKPKLSDDRGSSSSSSYAEEVKRIQIRNELQVESIVRQRSMDAFKSRCKYFEPPLSDVEARKWWDTAHRSQ